MPWDTVDDYGKLTENAVGLGMTIGAINSNAIQDDDYVMWSLCYSDRRMRTKAIHHYRGYIEIMTQTGLTDLTIWLGDGINYPGQDDLRSRQERLSECLAEMYAAPQRGRRMILEYKFFEPAFYAKDVPDWGTSVLRCVALGDRATVVLDTGHRAHRGPTSSSSSCSCCESGGSGPSTPTPAPTPWTTSWSAPRTRFSCP